ncbi:MAG: ABC transporter ATP-binding protein, partial [Synergistaceae bacterium]|nr:ABC transporter ATP-binding protein [Synergistaceae bacterium]
MLGEVSMDLIQPRIMSRIVDEGVLGSGGMKTIYELGLLMIALVIVGGLCGSLNNVFVNISGQNIGNEMRKDCFKKIMSVSFPELDKFTTGTLVTRVTNDVTQVQNFVSQFVRGMLRTFLLMFGSMYCVFELNFTFGLIVICSFPFILGCLVFCMMKADPLFMKLQAKLDRVNAILQEDISGIRLIKACVRESYEKIRFGRANEELTEIQLSTLTIFAFMNPVINALMYIVIASILFIGYSDKSAIPPVGAIMATVTYTTLLLHSVLMTVMLFQNISRGIASWKRLKEILQIYPKINDGNNFYEVNQHDEAVEFRNVSFSYSGSNSVLSNINLKIHRGETVAIMGTTGCGKTSLVNLIPRFYDVTNGTVFVDGVDVREYNLKDLREKIAFVMQK